jgi:3-hydroxyacyl-[acyl-carrier-protein] dehydratase
MAEGIDIDRILKILPHRSPFVLLDRVTDVTAGHSIDGIKCVSVTEPWFQGHFPGHPVMPGVLIVEALAQLGGILAYVSDPFDVDRSLMLLLGIDRARFRRPVVPGDKLELRATVVHRRARIWKFSGEARADGVLCASAQFLTSVATRAE